MASFLRVAAPMAAFALAVVPAFARADTPAPAEGGGPAAVRAFLDASGSPQPLCRTPEGRAVWATVQAFYASRGDRPAWVDAGGLSPAGRRLVARLQSASEDGLDPARYEPLALLGRSGLLLVSLAPASPIDAAGEVGLTAALARYATDLGQGAVDPGPVSVLWRRRVRVFDAGPVLRAAAGTARPDEVLDAVRPSHPQYEALRAAERRYESLLAMEPSVPVLPAQLTLRPGARSPHVRALRARLELWGDVPASVGTATSDVFDASLADGLKRFQARHGMPADGKVGPEVAAALDVPVRACLRQIALNLERWRWQDPAAGGKSVLVNIPTFELHAYDGAREALAMRVVTGKPDTPTPVFAQSMTSVVFSPYWNVPGNIAQDETMPAARRDLAYLRRMNLEVLRGAEVVDPARVDWRRDWAGLSFRQRPGATNSLGLVKFLLPNPFNVYLHDTPERALFARSTRAFSHGCVRLEKPEALARWILAGRAEWTPARIGAAMHAGRESAVALPEAIPVSIGYFTVWVDGDGTVEFRPDVYRHDAAQLPLLPAPFAPDPADAVIAVAAAR